MPEITGERLEAAGRAGRGGVLMRWRQGQMARGSTNARPAQRAGCLSPCTVTVRECVYMCVPAVCVCVSAGGVGVRKTCKPFCSSVRACVREPRSAKLARPALQLNEHNASFAAQVCCSCCCCCCGGRRACEVRAALASGAGGTAAAALTPAEARRNRATGTALWLCGARWAGRRARWRGRWAAAAISLGWGGACSHTVSRLGVGVCCTAQRA